MKKGFTIVELLVVIGLLGVVSIIAVPNILKSFNENKVRIYEQNLTLAETAAKQYASEHLNNALRIINIESALNTCDSSYKVSVNTLISSKYLKMDNNSMIDPRTNVSMNNINYCMYYLIEEGTYNNGKVIVKKVG